MCEQQDSKATIHPERISTGSAGLDDILGGGLPKGHLYLVEGNPGTGKTTLGLQFLGAGAKLGERVMYITLSESRQETEDVARSHGWSLDGIHILEYIPKEERLRLDDQYTAFHPSEIELTDTTRSILDEVEKLQPARIVFDSLSEMRLLARDSLRYRRQILALKQFFANRNCTVVLLDDRTAETGQDLQLQSIAHGVIILDKLLREYGRTRRRLEIAKLRGSTFREGYHDYTIEMGGVRVFPSLIAAEHRKEPADGLAKSGLPELDSVWGGGLERGTSTLVMGPAGVGKSSLCMHYAAASAGRGEFTAVFAFDEGFHTIIKRSEGLGLDLLSYINQGLLEITQVDPAELSPGELIYKVRHAVEVQGAKMIIIDSLNGLIHAMPAEESLMLQMHELLAYLSQHGVTTLLILSQSGILGTQMDSPINLSYLADNMLLLRYFEAYGQVRKALSVVKKRSGDHEDVIRELRLQPGGIVVGEPLRHFHGILMGVPTYTGKEQPLAE